MRYAISIDVGGTTIKAGLVGADGSILAPLAVPTPHRPDVLIVRCAQMVSDLSAKVSEGAVAGPDGPVAPSDVIDTIGFDIPGIVDEATGVGVFSANLGWEDFDARAQLSSATRRPVAFGHDVRTGAYAEARLGANLPDFLYIAIGTGIASVLVLDREPVAASEWAGELGQIPVCDCKGNTQSLESVSSATGIANRARELGLVGEDAGAAEVYALADAGNQQAAEVIDFALTTLAHAVAPVIAVVGKVPVVIGGGLANRGEDLFETLTQKINDALGMVPGPRVLGAALGAKSQIKGSALRAFRAEQD